MYPLLPFLGGLASMYGRTSILQALGANGEGLPNGGLPDHIVKEMLGSYDTYQKQQALKNSNSHPGRLDEMRESASDLDARRGRVYTPAERVKNGFLSTPLTPVDADVYQGAHQSLDTPAVTTQPVTRSVGTGPGPQVTATSIPGALTQGGGPEVTKIGVDGRYPSREPDYPMDGQMQTIPVPQPRPQFTSPQQGPPQGFNLSQILGYNPAVGNMADPAQSFANLGPGMQARQVRDANGGMMNDFYSSGAPTGHELVKKFLDYFHGAGPQS